MGDGPTDPLDQTGRQSELQTSTVMADQHRKVIRADLHQPPIMVGWNVPVTGTLTETYVNDLLVVGLVDIRLIESDGIRLGQMEEIQEIQETSEIHET